MTDPRQVVEDYAQALQTLAPGSIDALVARCTPDVHFADPFNDVTGRDAMAHVFRDMFEKLDEVGFEVREVVGSGERWALLFDFTASGRMIGRLDVPGITYVRLGGDGLVAEHMDFWDGGTLYERMPVLGPAVRAVKRRIAA